MYRRYRERYQERRRRRKRDYEDRPRHGLTSLFRTPAAQIAVLLIVALIIYLILQSAGH
jgi:hypothetical protein